MKYLSLFSGIGGFELGFPADWECVGYSEVEPRAIEIYQGHFPTHKNYGDITKINADTLPDFDLLCGGFPCQSFSLAGSRRGFDDTRGTLFFDIARIIKAKRPKYLLLENVKGLLSHDQGRTYKVILSTLTELGYDTEALVFDSYFFNAAPRQRVFMFACDGERKDDDGQGQEQAISLYACFGERVRNQNEGELQESVRDTRRIIRTFAQLPEWLDSWDTIYGPEVQSGERGNGECDKSNRRGNKTKEFNPPI